MTQSNEQALRAAIEDLAIRIANGGAELFTNTPYSGAFKFRPMDVPEGIDALLALFKSQATDRAVAVIEGRIDELAAVLSIYSSHIPHHEQIIALQQAKSRLADLEAEWTALLSGDKGA